MNDNTSPYGPAPRIREMLEGKMSAIIGGLEGCTYYPDQTAYNLRQKIASLNGVTPDQVVVGCGADEVIDMIVRVFVNHGDTAIVPLPEYWMYSRLARIGGAKVLNPSIGKPPELKGFRPERGKVLFISNPNNPAGNLFDGETIGSLAEEFPGIVILDEAYAEYAGQSLTSLVNEYTNLVVVRTFSKIYGLTNFRIGYSISSKEIAFLLRKIKNPFNVPSVSQSLALEALSDQNFVNEVRERNASEREYLRERLERMGVTVYPSCANFLLVDFGADCDPIFNGLVARGIFTRRISQPGYEGCIRITVRSRGENDAFLAGLCGVMGGMP